MKIIIFAGGTGKRFWPVSRKDAPKQFLPVIDDQPLVRLKYEYLRLGFSPNDIFISTGKQYEREVRLILSELPHDHFILEPDMRDTGPAVALAVAYVTEKYPNETISLQWSDHYIKKPEVFISALKAAEGIVSESGRAINIAEKPRFPTPHRGYIKYGKHLKSLGQDHTLCEFVLFTEKPSLDVAREYLQSGDYSWNLGYWVLNPKIIFEKFRLFAPQIHETIATIRENGFSESAIVEFKKLEKKSFDHIFSENLDPNEVFVINTKMGWHDVGEWISLKETLEENRQDTVIQGNVIDLESKDTLIYNYEPQKLVATINLDGFVVVNTKDVVAIFPKDDNDKLKNLLNELEAIGLKEYL